MPSDSRRSERSSRDDQRRRGTPQERPGKRSAPDDRNSSHSTRHDYDTPPSTRRSGGELGGRPGFPPPPKFSGAPIPESELLEDQPKKKFTGRCRLFVGNLSTEFKEQDLKELFLPYGEISECYISGKGFAFLRLDTRAHAEAAKEALDTKMVKGRQIRVRFAVHGAAIKVKELSPAVSNELLYLTFSAFGDVERAVHIVDEKGRPTGEGIIEFERKLSAQDAVTQIRERVFLVSANSRPLQAEFLEPKDEDDGLSEKMISKTHQLVKEREVGPRFATMNSFEYMYGRRWKELYEYENKRRLELEAELREQRRNLDADMELAYEDYKADMLREELQRRQEELERLEAARRQREERRHQFIGGPGGGEDGWRPPQHDGPLGRQPPPPIPFGGGPPNRPPPGMNGHGQQSLGPEVRKLLQNLDPVMMNNSLNRGQNQRGPPMPPGAGLPFPPPPINVLDRKGGAPSGGPLDRKQQSPANMNLLDRNPPAGPNPLANFMMGGMPRMSPPGGQHGGMRIPPPPSSLLGPAPMDFVVGEKRARR
uniref:RRM domain-containing protein n=1 Tax=Meloidogyne incognita TaxID=6306 RepID=A0A914N0U4_MELIC